MGKSIQCLPGQTSSIVCGKGYSCYFSGYNYQCCPTAEEEEKITEFFTQKQTNQAAKDECPNGSFIILELDGKHIKCNNKTKCPQVI